MSVFLEWLQTERGRGSEVARTLDVTPGAVWQWASDRIPAERVFKVSRITGIPVKKLRPDLERAE